MKRGLVILVTVCLLCTLIASCSILATPTPEPTATPTETVDFAATQTKRAVNLSATQTAAVPTRTPTPVGVLYFQDFARPDSEWQPYSEADSGRSFKNGAFAIRANDDRLLHWSIGNKSFASGILSIDVQSLSGGPSGASANILWRFSSLADNNSFYLFGFYNNGNYFVYKFQKDTWTPVIQNAYSKAFKPKREINNIKIAFNGEKAYFFVNDQFVNSMDDSAFRLGKIGLAVSLDQGVTSPAEFAFDNLAIYEYDESSAYLPSIPEATPTTAVVQYVPTEIPTSNPNAKLDITIKVFNNCDTPQTVLFQGPTYLKYKNVQPGETREMQAAQGTYTYTMDCCGTETKELTVSVWTLTLCYKE